MQERHDQTPQAGYTYVKRPLTEQMLTRIGNGHHVHVHVALPLDRITGPYSRGIDIEIERATLSDLTRWRLDDLEFQPYAVDRDHSIEFDVHATIARILEDDEVDENVRIPFSEILRNVPDLIEDLVFERLATNHENLVESYDTIELVGTDGDDLIVHVHATAMVDPIA